MAKWVLNLKSTQWVQCKNTIIQLTLRSKKRTYIVHPIDDLLKLSGASH